MQDIANQIGVKLLKNKQTIATAESCTGGNIAHQITLIPGSSAWYKGSIISYACEVKENILKVPHQQIETYGVVSTQVAESMANGVRTLLNVDYAIATTGIAGPTGGNEQTPVGTVCIAIATPQKVVSKTIIAGNQRHQNIETFTHEALKFLLNEITVSSCNKQ